MFSPRLYLRDWWIFTPTVVLGVGLLVIWWYTFSHLSPTAQPLFLHYTVVFGVDWVGEWWKLWLLPLFATAVAAVNWAASWALYGREKLAARVLLVLTVLLEAGALAGLFVLGGLNS